MQAEDNNGNEPSGSGVQQNLNVSTSSSESSVDGLVYRRIHAESLNVTAYLKELKKIHKVRVGICVMESAHQWIEGSQHYVDGPLTLVFPSEEIANAEDERLQRLPNSRSFVRLPNICLNNNSLRPDDFGVADTPSNSDDYPKSPVSQSRYKKKQKMNLLKHCLMKNLRKLEFEKDGGNSTD